MASASLVITITETFEYTPLVDWVEVDVRGHLQIRIIFYHPFLFMTLNNSFIFNIISF
jgi:hypothetical protein